MQEGLSDRLQLRKPVFHLAPATGWVNDPNGPLYYRGQYHLFYQHLPQGCEWGFGLVWGHAVSKDLIHWEHLPHALLPDAKSPDAAGCFSGCATLDTDGTPVILYTGVRLRDNPDSHPLPPNECDLKLPFIETQLLAVADPDDPHLIHWRKDPVPFLPLPPASMDLTGWRDPFVVERPCTANNHEWVVLIGSGIKNVGGTAVVYRTRDLRTPSSWQFDGLLCSGDGGTGAVWECPLVAPLKPLRRPSASATLGLGTGRRSFTHIGEDGVQQGSLDGGLDHSGSSSGGHVGGDDGYTHFYCISPDAPTNPSLYWIGHYSDGRFDLANAKGPFRLDLGDILYAPNIFEDGNGRLLMWGWLQERRAVGQYDYAGCMSLPRALYIDPEQQQLWQEPAPELKKLRSGEDWRDTDLALVPGQPLPLQRLRGCNLDIEATFRQGSATTVGLLLRSWQSEEAPGQGTAAVLYHWESQVLEVVFEALDPATMTYSLTAPGARRIGQQLRQPLGQPVITLRVMVDYSVLEVYTSTGEVLSTRAYRGVPPDAEDAGIEFVAIDGDAVLARVEAFEMRSIWEPLDAPSSSSAAAAGRPGDMESVLERLLSPAASAKEALSAAASREGSLVSHKSAELLMARGLDKLAGSRTPSSTNVTYPGDTRVLPVSPRLMPGMSPRGAAPGYSTAAAIAADALAGLDLGLELGLGVEGVTQGVPEEEMTLDIFGDLVGTP